MIAPRPRNMMEEPTAAARGAPEERFPIRVIARSAIMTPTVI